MSCGPTPVGWRRVRRAALFVLGCTVVLLLSGAWRLPADLPRGVEYFPPAAYAAAAAKGSITLSRAFDLQAADGVVGGEDMGYPILRQAWLLLGGDGAIETIAELHNGFILVSAVAFATAAAMMTGSLIAGWLSLALVLVIRYALRGLVFGAVDNRTLIVFFPLVFTLLLVLIGPTIRRLDRAIGVLAALGIGAIIGLADLVRHSEGLLAISSMALTCLLVSVPVWRRIAAVALVVLGSVAVTLGTPIGVRLFNEARTGGSTQTLPSSLQPLPQAYHSPWHTLQISLGRYPNPEGLFYNDLSGFLATELSYPELVKTAGPYLAARTYYLWYVRTHPIAWLGSFGRGLLEVFYFVPYASSVGNLPWALGYLPAKEGVVPALVVDPRDVPYDLDVFPNLRIGHGSLLNLRFRYLKLTLSEWLVFLGSLACLPAALRVADARGDVENRRVFVTLLCYVALGAGARALIPTYGQALVVAYWGMSILAAVYLGFAWWSRRRNPVTTG